MNIQEALDFIRSNRRGVLATLRRDGRPQLSPVIATVDDEGRVVISTRETSIKVKNLSRDPFASFCVFTDNYLGPWAQVEGPTEIVHLPEAMEPLVDYYRKAAGEHENWDDYRARMERERRVLLRMTVERAGPSVSG